MTLLIAEISNHHFGEIEKAKELIRVAKECGADLVKGQAFLAPDMAKSGSMPIEFYEHCQLEYGVYKDLIHYGFDIGIKVFFTIISSKFNYLYQFQPYKKIHAQRFLKIKAFDLKKHDEATCFISIPKIRHGLYVFRKAKLMYATPYLSDANEQVYDEIKNYYTNLQCPKMGISHHGKAIDSLLSLHQMHDLPYVEKHFFLGDEISWNGEIYRDCLHSFNPKEFLELAKKLGK